MVIAQMLAILAWAVAMKVDDKQSAFIVSRRQFSVRCPVFTYFIQLCQILLAQVAGFRCPQKVYACEGVTDCRFVNVPCLLIFNSDVFQTARFCHQVDLVHVQPGSVWRLKIQLVGPQNNLTAVDNCSVNSRCKVLGRTISGAKQINTVCDHHFVTSREMPLQRLAQISDLKLLIIQGYRGLQKVLIQDFADRVYIRTDNFEEFKSLCRRAA